nr:helix-turn-helix domain-containing protein [Kineosporia mesophila]
MPEPGRPVRDPGAATTSDEFVRALASLRVAAGESYRTLQNRTGIPLSTLNDTLAGRRKPRNPVIRQIVTAYAADEAQAARWLEVWSALVVGESAPDDPPTLPSGGLPMPPVAGGAARQALADDAHAAALAVPPVPRASRTGIVAAVATLIVVLVAGLTWQIRLTGDEPGAEALTGPVAGGEAVAAFGAGTEITVFNVEKPCQDQQIRECSLSLSRSPWNPRSEQNVAGRVFHEDTLLTDCVIADGRRIEDETGVSTHRWYHVKVPDSGVIGWLPAVRTRTEEPIPPCLRPQPSPSAP